MLGACQEASMRGSDALVAEEAIADTVRVLLDGFVTSSERLEFPIDQLDADLTWYSHGRRWDRAEFEDVLEGNQGAIKESRSSFVGEPDIRVLGPTAAVAAYRIIETLVDTAGAEYAFPHAVTQVWMNGPSGWRLAHVHVSSGGEE